jgi:hypothetical protein
MTEADVSAVTEMWARVEGAADIDLPWRDIETALGLLPKPAARAVSDDANTLFLLGPADVIFTVTVDGGKVSVTSSPLNSAKLSVRLEWSEPTPGTRTTRWSFAYEHEPPSEPWQTVSGSVSLDRGSGREQVDEPEFFARVLASRAGWPSYAQPAEEVPREEPPAPEAQPEPRRRRLTDVWGRPLGPGR